ncbi:MAG: hypothetical protein KAR20_17155 [Candidatus Heimdallarchaeota archaeon]|nr:hypothetical protein [Candidatus Heimdallarchaeota archaeon]
MVDKVKVVTAFTEKDFQKQFEKAIKELDDVGACYMYDDRYLITFNTVPLPDGSITHIAYILYYS